MYRFHYAISLFCLQGYTGMNPYICTPKESLLFILAFWSSWVWGNMRATETWSRSDIPRWQSLEEPKENYMKFRCLPQGLEFRIGGQDDWSSALYCLVMRDVGVESIVYLKKENVHPTDQLCHGQWSLYLRTQPQISPGIMANAKDLLIYWAFYDQCTVPGHHMVRSKSWPQTTQDPVTETGTYQNPDPHHKWW